MENNRSTIAIIGGGFCGTMAAVHLLNMKDTPMKIIMVNSGYPLSRGVAYSSYSHKHLLNVPAKNMSAFPDNPNHFIDWIKKHENYRVIDQMTLPGMYLPRNIYGNYLKDVFENAMRNKPENITVTFVHDEAIDIEIKNNKAVIYFSVSPAEVADKVLLATGNEAPENPPIDDSTFYSSPNYFHNPWLHEAVNHIDTSKDVLIIGNGLTMVDIVVGLKEKNHSGKIYSLSPNGFQILPHRAHEPYKALMEELHTPYDLISLVAIFRKHIRQLRAQGITGEAAVDSLRPLTQKIWQHLSFKEKKRFMYHLRHLWGVARHRLPMALHQQIQQFILDDKLEIVAGRIHSIKEDENGIHVSMKRRKDQSIYTVNVGRVINCTGPQTDISKMRRPLMKNMVARNLITPDEMRLGMNATPDGIIIDQNGNKSNHLYTIGGNLKGILWESTAVPELRGQAKNIVELILKESMVLDK